MRGSQADRYFSAWTAMANLFATKSWEEAAASAAALEVSHPERRSHVRHARACIAARSGDIELGLRLMRTVVDDGSWWTSRQLTDSDLGSLRQVTGFEQLRELMLERQVTCRPPAARRAEVLVHVGAGRTRVLVIALHMYGVTAAETLEKWAAAADGCIIAVPESVEHDGDGLPCWEDDVRIHEAISTALDASRRAVRDAALPVVLAGASQGANHAVRIAVAGDIPGCGGFLAIVGAPRPAQLLWPSTPSVIRGFSIAGGNDALTRGSQQRLTEALAAHGVTAHLEIVPELGHEYPESLPELAARAIDFILGQPRESQ